MSFEHLTTNDLVRIASAGGGLTLSATGRSVNDLVRIASAASSKGAQLTITELKQFLVNDLVRISAAGNGCVVLVE